MARSSAQGTTAASRRGFEPMIVDRPITPDLGDLVLIRAPESSGTVRDEAGGPVEEAVVTCDLCDGSVLSGPDGRFKLATPPYVIQYVVTARKGRLTGTLTAASGSAGPLDLVVRSPVKLSGLAYLPNGQPAAGVQIEGLNVDRSEPVNIVTAQDGSYSAEVSPGYYRFAIAEADEEPEVSRSGFGDSLAVMAEVRGAQTRLDFGPVPGTAPLVVQLKPERGFALWVIQGELSAVGNPPIELLKVSYGQLLYQPTRERVTLRGLRPGRYTVVWGAFHMSSPTGPRVQKVEIPASTEVSFSR
jgi:hypothetical protein